MSVLIQTIISIYGFLIHQMMVTVVGHDPSSPGPARSMALVNQVLTLAQSQIQSLPPVYSSIRPDIL